MHSTKAGWRIPYKKKYMLEEIAHEKIKHGINGWRFLNTGTVKWASRTSARRVDHVFQEKYFRTNLRTDDTNSTEHCRRLGAAEKNSPHIYNVPRTQKYLYIIILPLVSVSISLWICTITIHFYQKLIRSRCRETIEIIRKLG